MDKDCNELYRQEILRRNGTLLRALTYFGMAIAGVGALTRILAYRSNLLVPFVLIFAVFVALALTRERVVRLFRGRTTLVLYLVQAPVWVLGILLGTVLDHLRPAITFYLLLMALPLFIMDKPWRVLSYITFWALAFALAAWEFKPTVTFVNDMSYLVVFTITSLVITSFLLRDRLDSVRLFVESETRARTDAVTGLKNLYALECDHPRYEGKNIALCIARVDDLDFFTDMFGKDVSDGIMRAWASALTAVSGHEYCYRYSSQEVVVIIPDGTPQTVAERARRCQDEFVRLVGEHYHVSPTCSLGFVYGTLGDMADQREMVRHAEARLYEARRAGKLQIRGAEFDHSALDLEQLAAELGGNLQSDVLDQLTGLPNMQAFNIRANSLLDTFSRERDIAFIYFDLENFKSYNERFGIQRGDDLLRDVAAILRESFPNRLVARFGDDHFVVMCYFDEMEAALTRAHEETYRLHGLRNMPLKAGVYRYHDRNENISVACDRARVACRSVKSRYDVFWRVYDNELREADERRAYIIAHIDDAVENDWLRVFYQPIVRAGSREVVECEALIRWVDPTYGFMPPVAFIGELERAHLIHKADLWMMEHVCADYRARADAGLSPLPVSINLSRLDFVLCDVESELLRLTNKYGVPTHHLHVEVTESAIAQDFDELVAITNRLRSHGFEIWLDDFGSDYSSLTTLQDFPCDVVKLDLTFLRSFHRNERSRVIIQQMVELTDRLGAISLVEGVEEKEHLAFLAEIGCDLAQGYLISRPEPLEVLEESNLLPA